MNIQQTPYSSVGSKPGSVAIIGIGCRYPGAQNPKELWENIITRRRQFRRMPDVRLPLSDYQSDDKSVPDKTYGTRAAVLDGYVFDWAKHRIPKTTAETTDIAHWLTLDVVLQMLEDANYTAKELPRDRTQVIIGNTLTGEFTRSNMLRLRWPFINKLLQKNSDQLGVSKEKLAAFTHSVEEQFKSISPMTNEDSLAGGLANTIAGRVCNYLNLHGGGFTVDGACSSSLISIYTAATHLMNNSIDFAIAGGVDISLDPFELIGFAKTGALTQSEMTVYDKRGSGFIPGEGCGIVGMKRLEDAQRDGDKIYAVLDGWGMSSDGKGGITAPTVKGQSMALSRAYELAGINPSQLDFIEGHGTGTKVGDRIELLAIADALGADARSCGVTSFKSIVGHTKAAAGIGAFIKAVMSVNQRVLPPTAGCQDPHDVFSKESASLYPILRGELRPQNQTLRAGVSAMGFGGINLHVTLRSGEQKFSEFIPTIGERAALVSSQDSEVFCLSAGSVADLSTRVQTLHKEAIDISVAELADLACKTNLQSVASSALKLALVVRTPKELVSNLVQVLSVLSDPEQLKLLGSQEGGQNVIHKNNFFLSLNKTACRIAWAFPGQGSQRSNMARTLVERFDWAQDLVKRADTWAAELGTKGLSEALFSVGDKMVTQDERHTAMENLRQTQLAQPVITLVSLLWITYLRRLGLQPDAVVGHSLGELTAFYASDAFDEKALIQLATLRGQLMTAGSDNAAGSMASVAASGETVNELIRSVQQQSAVSTILVVANLNSPNETIASGSNDAIEALIQLASELDIRAKKLRVSNAFHSPLVNSAAEKLRSAAPVTAITQPLGATLISSCDGRLIDAHIDLADYFSKQITRQVNFIQATQTLSQHCDMVFEVGPGAILSQLITKNQPQLVTQAVESQAESFYDFNQLLALAFVHGQSPHWKGVYEQRLIRDFVSPSKREFLTNPCERIADEMSHPIENQPQVVHMDIQEKTPQVINHDIEETRHAQVQGASIASMSTSHIQQEKDVLELVADFTGFDASSMTLDVNVLDDLNLDSIKSAELVGRIATLFSVQNKIDPADYATATLSAIVSDMQAARGESPSSAPVSHVESEGFVEQGLGIAPQGIEPVPAATLDVSKEVADLVAGFTGFDAASIDLNANLLDDLNLDSIKSAELVGQIASHFNCQGKVDPADYATASLAKVVEDLNLNRPLEHVVSPNVSAVAHEPAARPDVAPAVAASQQAIESVARQVSALVAEFTGFDAGSITLEANLLDDLNLDSIKAAELVGRIAGHYNKQDQVDPADYATATLQNIVNDLGLGQSATASEASRPALEAKALEKKTVEKKTLEPEALIEQFYMQPRRSDLPLSPTRVIESGMHFGIYCEQKNDWLIQLAETLQRQGAIVSWLSEKTAADVNQNLDAILTVLPEHKTVIAADTEVLQNCIQRLHSVSVAAVKQQPKWGITFIQFGGNGLINSSQPINTSLAAGSVETASTSAFAATLHLENAELPVRVIDVSPDLNRQVLSGKIYEELTRVPDYQALYHYCHYNQEAERYHFFPAQEKGQALPRPVSWSQQDLVLVTGGGKGITAECALAFAKETGARMILVGSSSSNDEVHNVLQRYQDAGLFARYVQCDITKLSAVEQMMSQIDSTWGSVTALIHGAGLNKARRLEQTKPAEVLAEVSPKLLGLSHLCQALSSASLKMIAGFSSIIGVTGMPGNAWYAFANEALHLSLQQFASVHPQTQIVSLAYSVWDEIGMGARMGSVKRLAGLGISAIPPRAGIDYFLQAMLQQQPATQLVITGSLGGLDTWQADKQVVSSVHVDQAQQPVAEGRFLKNIITYKPGQEVVARTTLSVEDDLYLLDHNYRGTYLFPTVFGLEAMAQAVAYMQGLSTLPPLRIQNINLSRPIAVGSEQNKKGTTEIQIKAFVESDRLPLSIKVGISTEQSGFTRDHFSATFLLTEPEKNKLDIRQNMPVNSIVIDPATELYDDLLFQGPLFRRLKNVWSMSSQGALSSIEPDQNPRYFSEKFSQNLFLGDPACRDVLLQSAQLAVKGILLPISIGSIDWFGPADRQHVENTILADTQVLSRTTDHMLCNVIAVDESSGAPLERMSDYRLKQMEYDEADPMPEDWAQPEQRDQRLLSALLDEACETLDCELPEFHLTYAPELHHMKREQRHQQEAPVLIQLAQHVHITETGAAPPPLTIVWDQEGKPRVDMSEKKTNSFSPSVSLSHDNRHCLYVAGQHKQACDIEPVQSRSKEVWLSIFAQHYHPALRQLMDEGDTLNQAATRLWCALESIKKAGGQSISFKQSHRYQSASSESGFVVLEFLVDQQAMQILTLELRLTRPPVKMFAFLVHSKTQVEKNQDERVAFTNNKTLSDIHALEESIYSHVKEDEIGGEPVLSYRFLVTFKEVTTEENTVNFDTYADWMGSIRERAIATVAGEMVPDFISGQWGMVTNHSHVDIFHPLKCMDLVEARLRIVRAYGQFDSSVDMQFDWVKINKDGSELLVARSIMATTWVEIIGHGQVKVQPFPPYMQKLIADYLPTKNDKALALAENDQHAGKAVYLAPNTLGGAKPVFNKQFETSSNESNLVGNIYYANYYHWQSRVVDVFLRNLSSEFKESKKPGYFHCAHSKVAHLREAMPYDTIALDLTVKAIYQGSIHFQIAVYRVAESGRKIKLALIDHHSVWQSHDGLNNDIPHHYLNKLLQTVRPDQALDVRDFPMPEMA